MKNISRVAALVLALILIAMYVATFVAAIAGSEYVMGMIFLDVVVPVLCWGIWLIARLFRRRGEELRQQDAESDNNAKQVEKE